MNPRRIGVMLSAVAGGLLATASLPLATARADDYSWLPDTNFPSVIEYTAGIPPFYQELLGNGLFDWVDLDHTTFGEPEVVGKFYGVTEYFSAPGFSNEELLVTGGPAGGFYGGPSEPTFDTPNIGSVFDTATFGTGQSAIENVYSDLVGAGINGTNLINDTLTTPFGDFDLTWLFGGFDAAATAHMAGDLAILLG